MLHVPVPAYRPTALLWLMRFHSTIATVYCTQDNTPPETNFRAGSPPQIRGVHTTKMAALGRPRQHFSIARPVARRFLALPVVNRSSASKSARGAVLPYYYTNMNSIKIHKIMYDPCDTVRRHCFFFFFFSGCVVWSGSRKRRRTARGVSVHLGPSSTQWVHTFGRTIGFRLMI